MSRRGPFDRSTLGDLDDAGDRGQVADSSRSTTGSPLGECFRCRRLVEAEGGPRFCPWCGRPLSSIIGREIDGYRIDELLAEGGFGYVYLASNIAEPSMRQVVKFLRPKIACTQPPFVRIFVEEARLTEAISQSCWNIARVSNVRETPWPYYFMEYIRGTTLEDLIVEASPARLPIDDGIGYLRGIASALVATHGRGCVHRDLKPLNVMVIHADSVANAEQRVKVVDFGLALEIGGSGITPVESPGAEPVSGAAGKSLIRHAGTPEYMAPECFSGTVDVRTDIYAFGVMAYEVLTGVRPWKDCPPESNRLGYWRDCHENRTPVPILSVRPDVPKWLARLVTDCLAKDSARRTPDASVLLHRLQGPMSPWVWVAVAVVLVLVGLLAWSLNFESLRDEGVATRIDVRRVEELAGLDRELLFENDVHGMDWQVVGSSDDATRVRVDEDDPRRARLELGSGEDFERMVRRGEIEVRGERSSPFGRLDVVRTIPVVIDARDPVIDDRFALRVAGHAELELGSSPRALRVARKAELVVAIEDDHLVEASVALNLEGREKPQPGQRSPDGTRWSFSLEALSEGATYHGAVVAADRAGNSSRRDAPAFTIDSAAQPRWHARLSRFEHNRAFFDVEFDEPMRRVWLKDAVGANIDFELSARAGPSPRRTAFAGREAYEHLAPGTYTVAAVVDASLAGRALSFVLHVEDTANPINEGTCVLECQAPSKLTENAIRSIYVRPAGGESVEIATKYFFADSPTSWQSIAVDPAAEGEVRVDVRVDFVHDGGFAPRKVSCRDVPEDVDESSALLQDIRLGVDRLETIVLEFEGAFVWDRVGVGIALRLDTRAPDFHAEIRPPDGVPLEYVESLLGAELVVTVDATEVASDASFRINDEKKPRPLERANSSTFTYLFASSPELGDGVHTLRITVRDVVGRESAQDLPLTINAGAPRVDFLRGEPELELGAKSRSFVAADGNGVDLERSRVWISIDGEEGRTPCAIESGAGDQYRFRLDQVSAIRCQGELTAEIYDNLGDTPATTTLPFTFDRGGRYRTSVPWRDVDWILCRSEGARGEPRLFYMSRAEISNRVFEEWLSGSRSTSDGRDSTRRPRRPTYWSGERGFDVYGGEERDGRKADPGEYPLVGVSAEDGELFAREAFRARLPTVEEWLLALKYGDPDGRRLRKRYASGRVNFRGSVEETHPFASVRAAGMWVHDTFARSVNPVPVHSGPGDVAATETLHQLGNVAELVRFGDRPGRYGRIGGSFETLWEELEMRAERVDATARSADTGLRLVIDLEHLDRVDPRFLAEAEKAAPVTETYESEAER